MNDTTTTIGLSGSSHEKLRKLVEDGYFGEMLDGYRFAIALALAHGQIVSKMQSRSTIFNVGSLDPDKSLAFSIQTLLEPLESDVYRTAERLAEWGVCEMYRALDAGNLSIANLLMESEKLNTK
jgi:Arc/MetJ-type ribon-helix-helix transcriptional regulator